MPDFKQRRQLRSALVVSGIIVLELTAACAAQAQGSTAQSAEKTTLFPPPKF